MGYPMPAKELTLRHHLSLARAARAFSHCSENFEFGALGDGMRLDRIAL
jgi:hypothetical protein